MELTVGAVLAAGAGSRFGDGPKVVAELRGRALVDWALDAALGAGLAEVAVVEGPTAVRREGVTTLHNERWADGIATSLAIAIDWADALGASVLVVGLADQPFVTAEAWHAVAVAEAAIAVATYDGVRGNPVRLARDVWPLLPRTGDTGARAVMRSHPDLVVEVPCTGSAADIDTVEDLQRWS